MSERQLKLTRNWLLYPAGSVLAESGNTRVLCTASLSEGVPGFLRDAQPPAGWLTAEYSMLPGATNPRGRRENQGPKGRSAEIQRLIGRSLRAVVDSTLFPGWQISIDCDVLQADGGTRTTAINGACVALYDACTKLVEMGVAKTHPMKELAAAVSVGLLGDDLAAELNYQEDSAADVDMNVVMTESGGLIEVQGTAEGHTFSRQQLDRLLDLAWERIKGHVQLQKQALGL